MRSLRRMATGLALASLWVASATPILAADNGTVDAQVTVATPCVLVSPTSLDFGTLPFGGFTSQSLQYSNCGTADESIYARATNASGVSAAWSLTQRGSCAAGPTVDEYRLDLYANSNQLVRVLSLVDQLVEPLAAGASSVDSSAAIFMPCAGSSGIGTVMSFQIIFTATF